MNVDTATQFAFSRPVAEHMHENYDRVIVAEGNKKLYDPRAYLKVAEQSMKARVMQALEELRAVGQSICNTRRQ